MQLRKMTVISSIALSLIGLPAVSQSNSEKQSMLKQCLAELERGNLTAARELAERIKDWQKIHGITVPTMGVECLTQALGEEWVYSLEERGFRPAVSVTKTEAKAKEDAAAIIANFEAMMQKRRAEAAAKAAKKDEEDKLLAALAAERKRAYDRNAEEVRQLTFEACRDLFEDDQVSAMTNALCVDSFTRSGLPD